MMIMAVTTATSLWIGGREAKVSKVGSVDIGGDCGRLLAWYLGW